MVGWEERAELLKAYFIIGHANPRFRHVSFGLTIDVKPQGTCHGTRNRRDLTRSEQGRWRNFVAADELASL